MQIQRSYLLYWRLLQVLCCPDQSQLRLLSHLTMVE